MKNALLAAVCLFMAIGARAQQGMYGFEGGIGKTTGYKSYITPAVRGYYHFRISRSIYAGGELAIQRYSFRYDAGESIYSLSAGDALSIRQKSTYIFFCPKIDVGLGYRKYLHVFASFGPGVFMGGSQVTTAYTPFVSSAAVVGDTSNISTTSNIPTLIFKGSAGITERIPTGGFWNVVLSQQFTFLPGSLNKNGADLHVNYISFTVGIMHKYPMRLVEY